MDECKLPSARRTGVLYNGVDHSAWSVAECSCPTGNLVHTSTTNAFWFEKKKKKANPYKTPWFKDDPEGYYCLPWCCTGLQDDKFSCNGPEGYDAFPCGWLAVDAIRTTLRGPDNREGCTSGKSKMRCIFGCECTVCTPGQYVKTDIDQEDASKDRTCTHCGDNTFSATANAKSCSPQPYCTAGQRATYTSLPIPRNTQMSCTACDDGEYKPEGRHRSNTCRPQLFCSAGQRATYTSGNTPPKDQALSCTACDDGAYREAEHRSNTCNAQPFCIAGQYITAYSNTKKGACTACARTEYMNKTSHRELQCVQQAYCGIGEKFVASLTSERTCEPCADGFYQDTPEHFEPQCKAQPKCNKGQRAATPLSNTMEQDCVPCGEHTFQNSTDHRIAQCYDQPSCSAGFFISADSVEAKRFCTPCQASTYQAQSAHRIEQCALQERCTLGEFYTRNPTVARACEVCAEGTYQDLPDHVADTCMEQPGCPPAGTFYAPDRNATRTCQPCPPNTHQNVSEHRIQSCGDDPTCPDSPNGIGYEYNGTAAVYGSCVAATCNGDPDPAACSDGTEVIDCSDTFIVDDCKAFCGTCTATTTSTTTTATTITITTTTTPFVEESSRGSTKGGVVGGAVGGIVVAAIFIGAAVWWWCNKRRNNHKQIGRELRAHRTETRANNPQSNGRRNGNTRPRKHGKGDGTKPSADAPAVAQPAAGGDTVMYADLSTPADDGVRRQSSEVQYAALELESFGNVLYADMGEAGAANSQGGGDGGNNVMYADLEMNQRQAGVETGDVIYSSSDYEAVTTFDEGSHAAYSTIPRRGSDVIYTTHLELGSSGVSPPTRMSMRSVSEDVGDPNDEPVTYASIQTSSA